MVKKKIQNCSYRDDDVTNYVNFFQKLCQKWMKYVFFLSKINLVSARNKIFKIFSAFESQDNIQIEYI